MAAINSRPQINLLVLSPTVQENTVNAGGVPLFAFSSLTDDQTSFPGATLRIGGLLAEDRLTIANVGNGAGQVSFDGTNVRFGGTLIGTASGGQGTALEITFTMDAVKAGVEAVLKNILYTNGSDTPTATRQLTVDFHDGTPHAFEEASASPFDPDDFEDFSGSFSPTAVDIDGDGDLDLVVGYGGATTLRLFENTGSAFELVHPSTASTINTGAANNKPTFVDIDGDGDMDAFVHSSLGTFRYFENTGTALSPVYVNRLEGPANPLGGFIFNGANLGANASITFADLDGDGDLDAITGRSALTGVQHLNYFENTGTATAPVFALREGAQSPVSGLTFATAGANAPVLGDVDGDGDMDLVVAANDAVRYAENVGTASAPQFVIRTGADNPFNGVSATNGSRAALMDLDGDGDLDLVLSVTGPELVAYTNNSGKAPTKIVNLTVTAENDPNEAKNDLFSIADRQSVTGSVLADNGSGRDIDLDGDPLVVSAVNGSAANVGAFVTLPGGGQVRISSSGALSFNHNGKYEHLPAGAHVTETVTYTIRDPGGLTSSATVTIRINGVDNNDVVNGTAGADTLRGGKGNDTVSGLAGADRLYGDAGNDLLRGGTHGDLLYGGVGSDRLYGGPGNDRLNGDAGNDRLYGDAGSDTLRGGSGNDQLYGGAGSDRLEGGAGGDRLFGGNGGDKLYGGANNDRAYGGTGNDQLYGGMGVDRLYGGAGGDRLYGGASVDHLYGGANNDHAYGGAGNDRLYGGSGGDRLYGGIGNDQLYGGAGNDRLYGGRGNDTLHGGAGTDFAHFSGKFSDYTITERGARTIVAHRDGRGADGTDMLIGVEFLVFSDTTIAT